MMNVAITTCRVFSHHECNIEPVIQRTELEINGPDGSIQRLELDDAYYGTSAPCGHVFSQMDCVLAS
jgi:hypothetical protein